MLSACFVTMNVPYIPDTLSLIYSFIDFLTQFPFHSMDGPAVVIQFGPFSMLVVEKRIPPVYRELNNTCRRPINRGVMLEIEKFHDS